MIIHWSQEAIEAVREKYGESANLWKLVYDTEGCGCAVSGVAALWAITAPESDDLHAESEILKVCIEKRHEVFFDNRMRITYNRDHRAFQLASDGQIYTNRLRLEDRRTSDVPQ